MEVLAHFVEQYHSRLLADKPLVLSACQLDDASTTLTHVIAVLGNFLGFSWLHNRTLASLADSFVFATITIAALLALFPSAT